MRFLPVLSILLIALATSGCEAVRDQIPFGYGPRANESPSLNPRKQSLQGISARVEGESILVTWSYPVTNEWKMPAEAQVRVAVHCSYGVEGKPNTFSETAKTSVLPGSTRLVSGVVTIPTSSVEVKNLGATDPTTWFDSATWTPTWTHVLSERGPLTFEWVNADADGKASVLWTLKATSVPLIATATAKGAAPVTLDTSSCALEATCILVDKDGRAYASDIATAKGVPGEVEFHGWFRRPISELLDVDWGKSHAEVRRLIP